MVCGGCLWAACRVTCMRTSLVFWRAELSPEQRTALLLHDYWRILRRNWFWLLAPIALVAALMGGRAAMQPLRYLATAEVYVSVVSAETSAEELTELNSYVETQLPHYAGLITTEEVTESVSRQMAGALSADQVAQMLSAEPDETQSAIILRAVTGEPALTVRLADAGAETLKGAIESELAGPDGPNPLITARVTRTAELPEVPLSRGIKSSAVKGVILGLGLGVVAVAMRESLRRRFRDRRDLELEINEPLLASVVVDPQGTSLLTEGRGRGGAQTQRAYQQLRANLQFVSGDGGLSIVFVPVGNSAPAAVVAANLAQTLARAQLSVCLVGADFGAGTLGEIFGLTTETGLGEVLSQEADLNVAIQATETSRVAVLPAGEGSRDTADLLSSPAMGEVLTRLRSQFDYTLVATGSVPESIGAAVIAKRSAGAVLVVDPQTSMRADLAAAISQLEDIKANFLGAVWAGKSGR